MKILSYLASYSPLIFRLLLSCAVMVPTRNFAARPPADWNVVVLDKILAAVPSDQTLAQVGDMQILVPKLRAWRNQLAGGPGVNSAFDGVAPAWTSGNLYYTFDASVSAAKRKAFLDGAAEWAMFANLRFIPRTSQANYFTVKENPLLGGGQSAVGMVGGQQFLEIGHGAWNRGRQSGKPRRQQPPQPQSRHRVPRQHIRKEKRKRSPAPAPLAPP